MDNFKSKLNIANDKVNHFPTPLDEEQIQQDYDYFKAQEVAEMLYNTGRISLVEFNKLTQINRDTFSPILAKIMPKIT